MVASFTSIRVTNCKRRWIISVSEIHTPLTPSSDPRFNMPHDDSNKCKEDGVKVQQHVMAPMLNYYTNPWMWSKCSRKYITEFLEYVLLFLFFLPPAALLAPPPESLRCRGFFFSCKSITPCPWKTRFLCLPAAEHASALLWLDLLAPHQHIVSSQRPKIGDCGA